MAYEFPIGDDAIINFLTFLFTYSLTNNPVTSATTKVNKQPAATSPHNIT